MTGEYIQSPLRFGDSDGDFWLWEERYGGGTWEKPSCDRCGLTAVVSMGGTIISYRASAEGATEWAIGGDAQFLCGHHFGALIKPESTIKEIVTLALFDNGVSPDVIADVINRLDQEDGLSPFPSYTIKEAT